MSYTSWMFYAMVLILLPVYYILPKRYRWLALLAGSMYFYLQVIFSKKNIIILLLSVLSCYLIGILLQVMIISEKRVLKRIILTLGIIISALPLLLVKIGDFICESVIHAPTVSWIIPLGLSFYSLQLVAYLVDIYKGRINAQANLLKFVLFSIFFPQIIQGPISRYEQISKDLFEGNDYNSDNIMRGIQLVIWGFFLKYMIADKSAIIVNSIFDHYHAYSGLYIWIAAILYSFQLYTDFLSCTTMSQGVAQMFGIHLVNNFNHPYFATSIKEFWRRWHMSLSYWLRDYIYIPMGGNKHGNYRKWFNLFITFAVSGLWHGGKWKFLIWGLLHAFYQLMGEITHLFGSKYNLIHYKPKNDKISLHLHRIGTFILVMIGWIIFRADSFQASIEMIRTMIVGFNPWILFDDSLFRLGLNWKECIVLLLSLTVLLFVSKVQEEGIIIRDWFSEQSIFVRWGIYLTAIWTIWICGSYGFGFDAIDFIYGGF